MRKIRIHKDISVHWRIKTNGQATSLSGRNIAVVLTDPFGNLEKMTIAITDTNLVSFEWLGKNQQYLGQYILTATEDAGAVGSTAVDVVDFVELVERTSQEGGSDTEGLDTETVNLTSDLLNTGRGLSAYEVAVANGFVGTEAEWLASLHAPNLKIQYSANGTGSWHDTPTSADYYLRSSADNGTTWSSAVLFRGSDASVTKEAVEAVLTGNITTHTHNQYAESEDLAEVATSGDYDDLENKPSIPTKTSDLTNDSGFITEHQSLAAYRTSVAQDVIDATKASTADLESGTLVPALAKNIKGLQADNTAKFIRRTTAGSVDVEAGVSELDEIKGNSIVWNQWVDENTSSVTIPSGHKYLFRNSSLSTTSIITSDGGAISVVGGSDVVINLTQMFGAGNEPSTVAEFEALYGKSYYPYNEGQVLHNTVANFVTNGFNQMDSNGHFIAVNQPYQIVGTYTSITQDGETITPDANGIFTPSRGQVTVIGYDGTTCVHLVHSGDRNGQYEPHWESRLPLNLTTIKGKLNGTGNSITIFPEGLCGVGSAYDSIITNENGLAIGAWKRFGKVDLGSLNWVSAVGSATFFTEITDAKAGVSDMQHIICSMYSVSRYGSYSQYDDFGALTMAFGIEQKILYVANTFYSGGEEFKDGMQGVYLYYELATPEYYVLDEPFETYAKVDDYGMEWVEPIEDNQGNPTTAPFSATIKYGINVKDTIKNLPHNYRTKEAQDVIDAGKQDVIDSTHKLDNSLVGLTVVTTNPATLEVCKLYDLGEQSSLALVLPSSGNIGDWLIVNFVSGATPTTLTITSAASRSEFGLTPEANKVYEIYCEWGRLDASTYGWFLSYAEFTKA